MIKTLSVSAALILFTNGLIAQTTNSQDSVQTQLPVVNAPAGSDGQPIKQISGGVLNGKALTLPKPLYPAVARAEGASGAVSVRVLIDEEGKVISATALSGPQSLRGVAEDAARGATFSPTKLQGQPVKVSGVITYNFVSDAPAKVTPSSAPRPDDNKILLTLGTALAIIQSDETELKKFLGGPAGLSVFLKDLAANVPQQLKAEQALFDELAAAPEIERASIAARISDAKTRHLSAEQSWHTEVGGHIGEVTIEFARISKSGPPPAGARLEVTALQSRLRSLNDSVKTAPAGTSPEFLEKLKGIGAFADAKDLGLRENFMGFMRAFGAFIDFMPR